MGVKCLSFRKSIKDDGVIDAVIATREEQILIITQSGTMCRQSVGKISTQRREAQGVRIIKCDAKDFVVAMSAVKEEDEETATQGVAPIQ
jgi:DNA gyrase/topoisomerase IV subunit A